jgi:soluble lytic murein transglycosylase
MRRAGLWIFVAAIAFSNSPTVIAAKDSVLEDSALETKRQLFRDVYPAAERGDWAPAAALESSLSSYVLWPDLRAAYLRTRVKKSDDVEVRPFLDKYGMLKPARELRYRLALELAAQDNHDKYLALYEQFYAQLGEARLDCLALAAKIAIGQTDAIALDAKPLWLVGKSQVDECDPVFSFLRNNGQLDKGLHRERFALAKDQQQFSLALHLARSIDEVHIAESNRWLGAQKNPEQFIRQSMPRSSQPSDAPQLAYAVKRLARHDPMTARQSWLNLRKSRQFSQQQITEVEREIALWAARLNLPEANQLLADLENTSVNNEVIRWRIRSALRQGHWQNVALNIDALSADERRRSQWQYWKAVTLEETGHAAQSMLIMATLSQQTDYYGFLAADQLGLDYSFGNATIENKNQVIDGLVENKALLRARELYEVGLDGRGRSEWNSAIISLNVQEKKQAAILAHQWGWHSQAISTAAKIDYFHDLELRYPLPHRETFELYSSEAKISESWVYGVARNESLFMRDIRSSAGAVGVMQLMPETGRRTAREMSFPYQGRSTLTDPISNIRLGTFYLGKMYNRFYQHPVLATAAYNAGPLRVERWMPAGGAIDARVWIENIPFNETRKYVRRVLASDTIFRWRLTGETQRLSSQLNDISAASNPPQVAGY